MRDRSEYKAAMMASLAIPKVQPEVILAAFEEYLACTHNDGDPVRPSEDEVVRAIEKMDAFRKRLGGTSLYPGYPADGG